MRLAYAAIAAAPLALGAVTLPHTFTNGTPADADEVNANFAALRDAIEAQESRLSAGRWWVDASLHSTLGISGFTLDLFTVPVLEPVSGSQVTLTNAGSVDALLACEGSDVPTSGSCGDTDGDDGSSAGIQFVPPTPGPVEVCATFTHSLRTSTTGYAFFTLVLTESDDDTAVLARGSTVVTSGGSSSSSGGSSSLFLFTPVHVCSVFDLPDTAPRTVRLYKWVSCNSCTSNYLWVDTSPTDNAGRAVHFQVTPVGG